MYVKLHVPVSLSQAVYPFVPTFEDSLVRVGSEDFSSEIFLYIIHVKLKKIFKFFKCAFFFTFVCKLYRVQLL